MYQVIDDPNDEPRKPDGFSIWPFLIGAILAAIVFFFVWLFSPGKPSPVSYTHLRAHETVLDLVCRLLLEKKK